MRNEKRGITNVLARFACVVALAYSASATANMMVYPMTLTVAGNQNASGQLQIVSKSDVTQYVKVTVKRVVNPATPQETEEDITSWKGEGVVVSPTKFALPAGATRSVRVISMQAPQQEQAYRVYVEGVAGIGEEGATTGGTTRHEAEVNVNLVWGVLVRAHAQSGQPALARVADGVANTGNTRIGLIEVGTCPSADSASCTWRDVGQSIYPGATFAVPAASAVHTMRARFTADGKSDVQEVIVSAQD